MIPFFRKIRYRLARDNQFLNYSRYAIGEIVLVVIGILIALQINNWNENRKTKRQESTYYCKLSEDLASDIRNIESTIVSINSRQETAKRLLVNLLRIQEDKEVLIRDFTPAFRSFKFTPTKAAIQDITSSGKLENLRNEELKNRILNHYTQQDYALEIIQANFNQMIDLLYGLERFSDFGFQELPLYQDLYGKELLQLLKSTGWHKDPNSALFVKLKDMMNVNIIITEREKALLNDMKNASLELNKQLAPYCN
jgi:hypothetical protein